MSIKLMSAVWELDLQSNHKLVLLALADIADDQGGNLFPSIAHIGKKASTSERQTQRIMRELATSGFISVVGNLKGGKPGTTRNYIVNLDRIGLPRKTGDNMTPVSASGVTPTSGTGDTGDTQSTSEPTEEKDSKKNSGSIEARIVEAFEAHFWPIYPKQRAGSKEKALQAFAKAVEREGGTTARILRGLRAYAKSDEVKRGFAKGAAAWLNDDRWLNDYGQIADEPPVDAQHPAAPAAVPMTDERRKRIEQEKAMGLA